MLQEIMQWLIQNAVEIIGSALGIIYVLLAIRENHWCWLAGILNVLIYIYVFFDAGIFGNMSLQVVYLFISIYGWYQWIKGKNDEGIKISKITPKILIGSISIGLILFFIVYFLLENLSSTTSTHILDALTTSLGVVGTWLQARKVLENWLLWIFADTLSVILYLSQGLYPTLVFYLILIALAFNGYITWNKQFKKNIA